MVSAEPLKKTFHEIRISDENKYPTFSCSELQKVEEAKLRWNNQLLGPE